MLPVIEDITIHTGIQPAWLSVIQDSPTAQQDPQSCQKISEIFITHAYNPTGEDLLHFTNLMSDEQNIKNLSFILDILASESSGISCSTLSQILRLSEFFPQTRILIELTHEQKYGGSCTELVHLFSDNVLKIDTVTTLLQMHHSHTMSSINPLLLRILFSTPLEELESKILFIETLLAKSVRLNVAIFEKIYQYPDTKVTKKAFDTYVAAFQSEEYVGSALPEMLDRDPSYLLEHISDLFSEFLAAQIIRAKPELILQQFDLERLFKSINYLNPKVASQTIKQVLFWLKSPYTITAEQIAFIIFASNSDSARQLLMEIRPKKNLRITEAHAQSIIGRKNIDTLLALVRFIIKNNTLLLTQHTFTQLIAYEDWEKLADVIKNLQRNNMLDLLWMSLPIILSTRPSLLDRTINSMMHERERIITEFMQNVVLIPAPVRFTTETNISRRHDYAHQETFNNGTKKTIKNFATLYADKISDAGKIASIQNSIDLWVQSLPQAQKSIVQTALLSIESFSGHLPTPYEVCLKDCLLLSWCALNDQEQRESEMCDKDAYDYFLQTISDIKPGLCLDAHFKKLAESLICVHKQAVQAGPTMEIFRNKFPIIVKNHAQTYLQGLHINESISLYREIAGEGLHIIWPLIRQQVNQSILDEFHELAPQGLDTPAIADFEQHIDNISLSIPEFEGRASPKCFRP